MTATDTITADIDIAASPERVWRVLTDLERYAEWNPFITAASGTVVVGARFTATFRPAGSRGTRLRPRILQADTARTLRWKGSVVVPGLFDGEHVFTLTPISGGTNLRQQETFTGVLVPVFRSSYPDTLKAFGAMNEKLRVRAETAAPV
ncbi:SRPBCC domain-containing protein [Agromyces sp. NPDC049794]|uniref:SRPBCC domain-containing protein n=1 Tax=Agromyces sp. NPDC049794 TaxID=3154362 RepID=UPI003401B3E9